MKINLRIPTKEIYAYIEIQDEFDDVSEAVALYNKTTNMIKAENIESLSDKDFNAWLDEYLTSNKGDAEKYESMSLEQKNIIQHIKRAVKRIEYANGEK